MTCALLRAQRRPPPGAGRGAGRARTGWRKRPVAGPLGEAHLADEPGLDPGHPGGLRREASSRRERWSARGRTAAGGGWPARRRRSPCRPGPQSRAHRRLGSRAGGHRDLPPGALGRPPIPRSPPTGCGSSSPCASSGHGARVGRGCRAVSRRRPRARRLLPPSARPLPRRSPRGPSPSGARTASVPRAGAGARL